MIRLSWACSYGHVPRLGTGRLAKSAKTLDKHVADAYCTGRGIMPPGAQHRAVKAPLPIPTVSLGVTSAVVSSCGHDSGQIESRVAQ